MSELDAFVVEFSLHKDTSFTQKLRHIVCGYNENNVPQEITEIINHIQGLRGKCEIFYVSGSRDEFTRTFLNPILGKTKVDNMIKKLIRNL